MEINFIHTMIRLHPAYLHSPQNYKHHSSFLKEKTTYWTSLSVEGKENMGLDFHLYGPLNVYLWARPFPPSVCLSSSLIMDD